MGESQPRGSRESGDPEDDGPRARHSDSLYPGPVQHSAHGKGKLQTFEKVRTATA